MVINYSKINRLTRVTKVNGITRYTFVPEPKYQYPNLNPPIPTIHYEGSKMGYIKRVERLIQMSPSLRRYLSIPEQPQMTKEELNRMNDLYLKLNFGPGLTPEELKEYKSF